MNLCTGGGVTHYMTNTCTCTYNYVYVHVCEWIGNPNSFAK